MKSTGWQHLPSHSIKLKKDCSLSQRSILKYQACYFYEIYIQKEYQLTTKPQKVLIKTISIYPKKGNLTVGINMVITESEESTQVTLIFTASTNSPYSSPENNFQRRGAGHLFRSQN